MNKKEIATLKTVIDLASYRRFFFFNLKRRASFYLLVALGVFGIVYTIFVLVLKSRAGETIDLLSLAPFLILVGAYIVYAIIIFAVSSAGYKKNKATFLTPLLYTFYDDEARVSIEGARDASKGVRIKYRDIAGVYESKSYLYLKTNDKKTYLIKKERYAGNIEDVVEVLKSIPGVKYRKTA